MNRIFSRQTALVVLSALLLLNGTSCVYVPQPRGLFGGTQFLHPQEDRQSFWNGDSMSGRPSIRINLEDQRAYYYKGGKLAGLSIISSGREGLDTVKGHFHIIEKDRNHKSSLFGDYVDAQGNVLQQEIDTSKDPRPPGAKFDGARMPFFMRIVGGTGMHEGYLPGYPASHGCIRMPARMAEIFFSATPVGTPVTIE